MAGIFGALALLCLAAALHPFTTYPVSLNLLRRRSGSMAGAGSAGRGSAVPRVAVCVCAYNEAKVIAARAANILAQRENFPDLDVLFYVDAASDETASILRGFGDAIRVVEARERHGKSVGMNTLVGMTEADLVVFSDANVQFAPGAIARLVAAFDDPKVGCACGQLFYTRPGQAPGAGQGTATAAAGSLYWRLEEHIKALESETGSVMGADGSIFAIRRHLHRPPPADLIDDMFVSLSVLCQGYRIVRAAEAHAFEEGVSLPSEEFRRKIRIACQAFNVNRALFPALMRLGWLDRYKYVSHKLLRWLCAYSLAASAGFGLAAIMQAGGSPLAFGCALAGMALAVALLLTRSGPVGKLREILSAILATAIGVFRSMRGERFQTWNPPASARVAVPGLMVEG